MIKIDLPTFELDEHQPRCLEILRPGEDEEEGWERYYIERFGADGQVLLRHSTNLGHTEWVDLSRERYRWILRSSGEELADSPEPRGPESESIAVG